MKKQTLIEAMFDLPPFCEKYTVESLEYFELCKKDDDLYQKMRDTLTSEDFDLVEKYINNNVALSWLKEQNCFVLGFQAAMRIVLEK